MFGLKKKNQDGGGAGSLHTKTIDGVSNFILAVKDEIDGFLHHLRHPIKFLKQFRKNRSLRGKVVLFLLLLALGMVVTYRVLDYLGIPPGGAKRVLICPHCDNVEIRWIKGVAGEYCSKCGCQMGYGWKCRICGFEYPVSFTPPRKKLSKHDLELREKIERKCPNCKGFKNRSLTVEEIQPRLDAEREKLEEMQRLIK